MIIIGKYEDMHYKFDISELTLKNTLMYVNTTDAVKFNINLKNFEDNYYYTLTFEFIPFVSEINENGEEVICLNVEDLISNGKIVKLERLNLTKEKIILKDFQERVSNSTSKNKKYYHYAVQNNKWEFSQLKQLSLKQFLRYGKYEYLKIKEVTK